MESHDLHDLATPASETTRLRAEGEGNQDGRWGRDDVSVLAQGASLLANGFMVVLRWERISTAARALAILLICLISAAGLLQALVPADTSKPVFGTSQLVLGRTIWSVAAFLFTICAGINAALVHEVFTNATSM